MHLRKHQTPKIILEKAKEIAKNIDKYDPDDINVIEAISKQLETGKYEVNYDDKGVGRVKIFKTDESGKPIGILKETTLSDLANEFQPHMKSNYQAILKDFVSNTAVTETEIQRGLTTTTKKGVEESVKNANAKAFGEYIANTPSEAYAVAKRNKIDEKNKEEIAKIAAEEFKNSLDSTLKVKTDLTEARLRAEASAKKKEQEIVIARPTAIKEEGEIVSGVNLQKDTKSFPLGKVIIDSGQGKQQKATNVFVSPKGKMYLRVEETGFESGSQKQTVYTDSGKRKVEAFKRENEKLKKEGKPEKPMSNLQLDFGDTKDVSISEKKPVVKMLDFGKDGGEIGRYAIRMGYNGTEDMTQDFIRRSGGDEFIITPEERNQPAKEEKKKVYGGVDADGKIIWK